MGTPINPNLSRTQTRPLTKPTGTQPLGPEPKPQAAPAQPQPRMQGELTTLSPAARQALANRHAAPGAAPNQAPAAGKQVSVDDFLAAVNQQAEKQAAAIEHDATEATSGNVVARGFNSLVNQFNGKQDQMEASKERALRALRTQLPKDLATFHQMMETAGQDPAKQKAALEFLNGAMAKAAASTQDFQASNDSMRSSNKFWAGLTADVTAGLAVVGGVALTATGVGAPMGVAMIMGGFAAGGTASVGAHALLDNQYDFNKEALGNFVVGGLSSAAMVVTGGASTALTSTVMRAGATNAAVGAATSSAGSVAQEAQNGFQEGWAKRTVLATAIGAGSGFVGGAVGARLANAANLPSVASNAFVNKSIQAGIGGSSGALGSGSAAVINEAIGGFQDGWSGRVAEQTLGGALAGGVMALGPDLHKADAAARLKNAKPEPQERALASVDAPESALARSGPVGAIFKQQYAQIAEHIQTNPQILKAFEGTSAPAGSMLEAKASWALLSDAERPVVARKLFSAMSDAIGKAYGFEPAPFEMTPTPGCNGKYSPSENRVQMDPKRLATQGLEDVMNTYVHEQTHAYQKYLVDNIGTLNASPEVQAAVRTFQQEMDKYFHVPEALVTSVRGEAPLLREQLMAIYGQVTGLPDISPEVTSSIDSWKAQARANATTPELLTDANKALFKVLNEAYRSQLVESHAVEAGESVARRVGRG